MNIFDIYVINLDKDKSRLEEMTQKLYPHHFIRVPGIYGEEINVNKDEDIFFLSRHFTPKSAIGCNLSHRKAIRTFLNTSSCDYAVILEDDAIPVDPNFMDEIKKSIQNASSDWDMIKLDYLSSFFPVLNTANIINKKSARKMLEKKVYYHIDIDYLFFSDLKIYCNPKILFVQKWDEKNNSNNKRVSYYNPISYIHNVFNFKAIRFSDLEITFADILLFLLIFLFVLVLYFVFRSSSFSFPLKKPIVSSLS